MRTPNPLFFRRAALLSLGLLAAGAQATIVVHDTPFAIPYDTEGAGMYLNVATGAFGADPDAPALAGVDFHLYLAPGPVSGLLFGANALQPTNAWVGSNQIGPFSLDAGETIDAANWGFTTRNGVGTAFRQDRTGYLGVRFFNEATNATNYGWLEITTLPGTNAATFTATVNRWAYEDSGAGIVTGAAPEPASLAALGLGGLALLRRRRR